MIHKKVWRVKLWLMPIFILGVLFIALPYFTFGTHPFYTTSYVCIGTLAFLLFLRSRDYWFFKAGKNFDKIATLLIWTISLPVFFISGIFTIIVIFVFPSLVYVLSVPLATVIIFIFGIRLKVPEKMPKGQFIVTPNHCSDIDDVLNGIIMGFHKWKVVYASEIRRIPLVGLFLRIIGIPLSRTQLRSRNEVSIKIKHAIDQGYNLLIFPEGKRLAVGKEYEYLSAFDDNGAFYFSEATGVPILPVVISWTFLFKPRSGQWWFSPCTIVIYYLEPMTIGENEEVCDFKQRVREVMLQKLKSTQPMVEN